MNKLRMSTLNICIVTFPWDDEQTACVQGKYFNSTILTIMVTCAWEFKTIKHEIFFYVFTFKTDVCLSDVRHDNNITKYVDEQTACVHSQHLYCYISLGRWTNCLCPLSTSVLLHFLGKVNKLLVSTLNRLTTTVRQIVFTFESRYLEPQGTEEKFGIARSSTRCPWKGKYFNSTILTIMVTCAWEFKTIKHEIFSVVFVE
jgi:hypothetical protein